MSLGSRSLLKSPKEFQEKADEYFQQQDKLKKPYTITGLAYYLGFESRQSFYDYEKRKDYSYTVKRNRLKCEMYAENRLFSNAPTGAIFALKNYGWKDKSEIEHSGDVSFIVKSPIEDNEND